MSRIDCSAKGNGKGTSIGNGKRQDKDDGNGEEKEGTRYMLSGQTWLLCPAASGRSVPPKRDGDRMGVRSSGGLLERPRQAQVEVHRRREVRLKVLLGWGARLDRHCCTSSPESPCAQGGPSCAPTMEAFWSAECPERY